MKRVERTCLSSGKRGAETLPLATHHLEKLKPNFFFFLSLFRLSLVLLCFHLLDERGTAREGGRGNAVRGGFRHVASVRVRSHRLELQSYDTAGFGKQRSHLSTRQT